jgi:hypothetical protein
LFGTCAIGAANAQDVTPIEPQIEVELPDQYDESIFLIGGRFHTGYFGHSFTMPAEFEDNYLIGVGYQRFFQTDPDGWNFGVELGLAGRVGEDQSLEGWGGVVARYDGWVINDTIRVSPSITAGLSAVTSTIGVEREREARQSKPANLLYYLGPEISFSHVDRPETEVFVRVQHRSGLWGLTGFAGIDGSNAVAGGVRFKF